VSTPRTRRHLDLSKPLPIGRGVGFRLSGSDAESGSGFGEVSVNTAYNQMRASYDVAEDGERKNASATMAGGVIFAGGGLFFTRPLETSAAVVEVTGLRRVRIMADNVEVARTGRSGRALVPRLLPYLANRISFNETDIPFDLHDPRVISVDRTAFSWRRRREVRECEDPGPYGIRAHDDRRPRGCAQLRRDCGHASGRTGGIAVECGWRVLS
jgi:hypothetical protein